MTGQRTYWHLQARNRRPSDYDIATSRLLYYLPRGFEVRTPADAWYERYQAGSPLRARDWDAFRDPRELTYSKYVAAQRRRGSFVDGLLQSMDETGYDHRLSPDWLHTLGDILPTLRYPLHGLQMLAAYVGHMAPSGRIAVACALQAADEIRAIQLLAYRMCQLQQTHAGFGEHSKDTWQRAPRWQPLRECVERLLVTYDWGEAFVALALVLKPMFDEVFTVQLARLAERRGDELCGVLLFSLAEDRRWHREWSAALARLALADVPANRDVIAAWIDRWQPRGVAAIAPFAEVFGARTPTGSEPPAPDAGAILGAARDAASALWREAGLDDAAGASDPGAGGEAAGQPGGADPP